MKAGYPEPAAAVRVTCCALCTVRNDHSGNIPSRRHLLAKRAQNRYNDKKANLISFLFHPEQTDCKGVW